MSEYCLHSWRYINKSNRFCVKCRAGAEVISGNPDQPEPEPGEIGDPVVWRVYECHAMRSAQVMEFVDE